MHPAVVLAPAASNSMPTAQAAYAALAAFRDPGGDLHASLGGADDNQGRLELCYRRAEGIHPSCWSRHCSVGDVDNVRPRHGTGIKLGGIDLAIQAHTNLARGGVPEAARLSE